MQGLTRGTVSAPYRPALPAGSRGFAVTVLPASPYQVSYVPVHHVIGFTFERQQGIDAFDGALARKLGRPNSARAVGLANGANPIAIVVPCHRVIGADASLTGYGGGVDRKRWLLAHEGAALRT